MINRFMDRREFTQRLLVGVCSGYWGLAPQIAVSASVGVRRRLSFSLTFTNPFGHPLDDQVFWCYLPASVTAAQHLRDVHVSMPHRLQSDVLNHTILELAFAHVPAFAQQVVTVRADVDLSPKARTELLVDPLPWLQAERYIESDDSRIRRLANHLHRSTPLETVYAIYEWVRNNIQYAGYVAADLGAVHALIQRQGDCTEYADLVVALARVNEIPARMIGGYVLHRDSVLRASEYHNWAEVYLDGTWCLVDAQKGNWLEPVQDYVCFRIYRDASINNVGGAHRYRMQGNLTVLF